MCLNGKFNTLKLAKIEIWQIIVGQNCDFQSSQRTVYNWDAVDRRTNVLIYQWDSVQDLEIKKYLVAFFRKNQMFVYNMILLTIRR